MTREDIYGLDLKHLEEYFKSIGENPAKAKIVFRALYKEKIKSFSEIQELSVKTNARLKSRFTIGNISLAAKTESEDTCKYLFKLGDCHTVESVLMKHSYGNSVCVSTQIGCNMDCAFCESGKLKKIRNLTCAEITGQVMYVVNTLKIPVSNIVLMGIGEPFDNYENITSFINIMTEPFGLAIPPRRITVSTVGLVPKIYEFAKRDIKNSLTVSLHAPNDEIRSRIMPVNKKYPIAKLIEAVKNYIENGGKKVTFAYIMIDGVNDSTECALKLSNLVGGINCCVNLIPYNETNSSEFKKSSKENTAKFFDILKQHKINVTVRREFGSEMKAACGQLRADYDANRL